MQLSKILWINPVGTDAYDEVMQKGFESIKRPDTIVDVVSLDKGPEHLEYRYYEALVLPEILHKVKAAERAGYDATIIGCFYDLGLQESREMVKDMVVTAPGEACSHLAATMGEQFSVIVTRSKCISQMKSTLSGYGMKDKLASFKSLGLAVDELHDSEEVTFERMVALSKEAIQQDGAELMVLGCTIQFGYYEKLQKAIGVPVIDAVIAPFKQAELIAELKNQFGWTHSKVCAYEEPPISEIKRWDLEEQYELKGLW